MIVIVTRNAPGRWRGFLASCMCEIAPGVYTAPRMSKAVRSRVWSVLESWHDPDSDVAAVMTWKSVKTPGGQAVAAIGTPRVSLVLRDGIYMARRDGPGGHRSEEATGLEVVDAAGRVGLTEVDVATTEFPGARGDASE